MWPSLRVDLQRWERDPSSYTESFVYFTNPFMGDNESDWSPLHDAAYHGRLLYLCSLIDQGVSINLLSQDRLSPLHVACQQGHTACAKLLIDHGANVNATTSDGDTSLSYACAEGHLSCVKLLLQHGATHQGPTDSTSPIHQAAAKGHVECLQALVQQGANVDRWSQYFGTPLYTACANQHLSTVKKLLQLGANANGGLGGNTPLHLGAQRGWLELVSTLLDYGANAHARDPAGNRPQDLAPPNSATKTLLTQRGGASRLTQLCRLTMRSVLGRARLCQINSLPLPSELKQYLLYQVDKGARQSFRK